MRLRNVIPAGIVAVALSISACSSTVTTSSTTVKPSVHVSVTHSAPTLRDQLRTWDNGVGGTDWKQVISDVNQLAKDASANNQSATEDDGAVLASDAQNAASVPIPGPAKNAYVMAMNAYANAGTAASTGDFNTAGADISAVTTFLSRVEAALKNYGG